MLSLPTEPNGYSSDTRPPAPAWLVDAVPSAKSLAADFAKATAAAKEARAARAAATVAFREASVIDRDRNYVPRRNVVVDEWRRLQYEADDARKSEERANRLVKTTWHALRDHLAASPEAAEVADRVTRERHAATLAAFDAFEEALAAFAEADKLTPSLFLRRDGAFSYVLSTELARIVRDAREVIGR